MIHITKGVSKDQCVSSIVGAQQGGEMVSHHTRTPNSHRPLPITHYSPTPLPTTHYPLTPLSTTHYPLLTTHLPTTKADRKTLQ